MFRCDLCGRNAAAGEKRYPVVISVREYHHPARSYLYRGEKRHDTGGSGMQIVKEASACKACAVDPREPAVVETLPIAMSPTVPVMAPEGRIEAPAA